LKGSKLRRKIRFKLLRFKRQVSSARRVAVACHQNADPDAVCSAFVLARLLRKLRRGLRVFLVAPEGLSKVSREVLNVFPAPFLDDLDLNEIDLVVLVDTAGVKQLGGFGEKAAKFRKPIVIIDHHAFNPEMRRFRPLTLIDEEATSTCEIVYKLYRSFRVKLSRVDGQALMVGIAFDTKHFSIANSETFRVAAELCRVGAKPEEAVQLLKVPMDRSERIARLKAAQRLSLKEVSGWTLAFSTVSSFQASAARAIVGLGADVAVVGGERKGEVRVSLRSSLEFYNATRVHLGRDIAVPLGRMINGSGSGHATAAGVNGSGSVEEALKKTETLMFKAISEGKI